jgi:hypothetical protein
MSGVKELTRVAAWIYYRHKGPKLRLSRTGFFKDLR